MNILKAQRGFVIRWVINTRTGAITSEFVHLRPEWFVFFLTGKRNELFHKRNARKLETLSLSPKLQVFAAIPENMEGLLVSNHRDHYGLNQSMKQMVVEYTDHNGNSCTILAMWDVNKEALNLRILEAVHARYAVLGLTPPANLNHLLVKY